jgi:hypothetical protein
MHQGCASEDAPGPEYGVDKNQTKGCEVLGFFKGFFGAAKERDSELASNLAIAAKTLDIDMAVSAHENWKLRLSAFLDGASTEHFSAEEICFDDRCDLGRWIHGDGKARLGSFPGFTALMGHHKMFHYAASNVVALSKAGKVNDAQAMLQGQFTKFSGEVIQDLELLRKLLQGVKATRR